MKYKDLTPQQLRAVAEMIDSDVDDMRSERDDLAEYHGFDIVAALRSVVRRLEREAKRREAQTSES